jgi:hypothetical protein
VNVAGGVSLLANATGTALPDIGVALVAHVGMPF